MRVGMNDAERRGCVARWRSASTSVWAGWAGAAVPDFDHSALHERHGRRRDAYTGVLRPGAVHRPADSLVGVVTMLAQTSSRPTTA